MIIDFILVLARDGSNSPDTGYMVGYSRPGYDHHYYPKTGQEGMDGPKVVRSGGEAFGRWFAAILNHLSGRVVFPPMLLSYLGDNIVFTEWKEYPE